MMMMMLIKRKATWQIVGSKLAEARQPLPKELSNIHSDLLPQPEFASCINIFSPVLIYCVSFFSKKRKKNILQHLHCQTFEIGFRRDKLDHRCPGNKC